MHCKRGPNAVSFIHVNSPVDFCDYFPICSVYYLVQCLYVIGAGSLGAGDEQRCEIQPYSDLKCRGLTLFSHWFYAGVTPLISVDLLFIYIHVRGIRIRTKDFSIFLRHMFSVGWSSSAGQIVDSFLKAGLLYGNTQVGDRKLQSPPTLPPPNKPGVHKPFPLTADLLRWGRTSRANPISPALVPYGYQLAVWDSPSGTCP